MKTTVKADNKNSFNNDPGHALVSSILQLV